jgi:hypothetical protein
MSQPLDTLWYTRCPVPTGLGIAVQQGWLQEDLASLGTQVQSLREAEQQAVRESHFDHSLLNSVRHGGSIPAIWARAQGRDTRVIGLSWADEAQLILTRPDSGIHTVKDLKGRRFGLPDWAAAQIDFTRAQALRGLENALKLEGLQVGDVALVNYRYDGTFSDRPVRNVAGTPVSSTQSEGRNLAGRPAARRGGRDLPQRCQRRATGPRLCPAHGDRHRQPPRPADPQQQWHTAHPGGGQPPAGAAPAGGAHASWLGAARRALGPSAPG